jgi:hypothetical protein
MGVVGVAICRKSSYTHKNYARQSNIRLAYVSNFVLT